MDKPVVIRISQEEDTDKEEETENYMVDRVVSYFTHADPEEHRKKWKKRKVKKTPVVDYYYV